MIQITKWEEEYDQTVELKLELQNAYIGLTYIFSSSGTEHLDCERLNSVTKTTVLSSLGNVEIKEVYGTVRTARGVSRIQGLRSEGQIITIIPAIEARLHKVENFMPALRTISRICKNALREHEKFHPKGRIGKA